MTSGANPTQRGPSPSKGKNSICQYIVWFVIGLIVALALAASAGVSTPSSSFPITVDGAPKPTEYTSTSSLSFTSGSLYSDPDFSGTTAISGTNASTIVVSNKVTGQKGYWLCGKIESTKITDQDNYTQKNQVVAKVSLSINCVVKNVATVSNVLLKVENTPLGFIYNVEFLDGPNAGVTASVADCGILMAAQVTDSLSFTGKALVTEFAIPLDAGSKLAYPTSYPANGQAYRVTSKYYKPGSTTPLQITDALVTVTPTGPKNSATYLVTNDNFFVPKESSQKVTIGNIGNFDPTKSGVVSVQLTGLPSSVLSANGKVDYTYVALRNAEVDWDLNFLLADNTTPGSFYTTGAQVIKAGAPQINADGTVNLTLFFYQSALAKDGLFTLDTHSAEFAGFFNKVSIAAKVPITISGK